MLCGGRTRVLMKFDVSSIPAGATIQSATLTVNVTTTSPGSVASMHGLHRVLISWSEGAKTGFGGGSTASATQTITGNGSYSFSSTRISWRMWMMISAAEATPTTIHRFAAREGGANGTGLVVQFVPAMPIPTVSEWGLIILELLMLTVGALFLRRQPRPMSTQPA